MHKQEARTYYRQQRMALTAPQRNRMDDLMLIQFQTLPLPNVETVLSYEPLQHQHEPESSLCVRYLEFLSPQLRIAFPVTDTVSWHMKAIEVNEDTEFQMGKFGLLEPVDGKELAPDNIDLVLVPLLVMDKKGFRVGYGKGVYDRFLTQCRPDCIKVGLSYFEPIEKIEDRGEFDVPLDFAVTPEGYYVF